MILQAVLVLIWMIAPPSPAWEEWMKIIVAISVPLLLLSGILFLIAFKGLQQGKAVWLSIMRDFILTDEFCKAVNACRKQAEWDFTEKMRLMMKEHEEEEWPHGKWRHDHYVEDIGRLEQRVVALEQRGGRRETDQR